MELRFEIAMADIRDYERQVIRVELNIFTICI